MINSGLRRSLEKWFNAAGVRPKLVGEFEDPALTTVLALHGLGFIALPTLVAKESITRFGFRAFGRTDECQQQCYAITAEGKVTHPAVVAITANAKAGLAAG